jgi:hypothetical protein
MKVWRSEDAPQGRSRRLRQSLVRLTDLFLARPELFLVACLIAHAVALCTIALLAQPTLPLDVIEQIGWSRDPQFAYFKHPPLPAWILGAALWASGQRLWAAALVGPLATTLTLWLLWRLARRIVDPVRAALAVMILEGVVYFNFDAFEFNHNIVQLPLWALIALFGHRACREGRLCDWLGLGAAAGLGMLGKYSTALLLLSLFVAFLVDETGRRRLASTGPWLALLVMLAVLAPHLYALYAMDCAPFRYPFDHVSIAREWIDRPLFPLLWLGSQVLNVSPALCLIAVLLSGAGRRAAVAPSAVAHGDRRFALCLAAGPLVLGLAIQFLGGLLFRTMWGTPMWGLLGLVAATATTGRSYSRKAVRRFAVGWLFALTLTSVVRVGANLGEPSIRGKAGRLLFPAEAVAREIGEGWSKETGGAPLNVVIGDSWYAGLLSAYSPDRPSVLIDGAGWKSPWITEDRLRRSGAVIIWPLTADRCSSDAVLWPFPQARAQAPLVIPYKTEVNVPPALIGWAIIPPGTELSGLALAFLPPSCGGGSRFHL